MFICDISIFNKYGKQKLDEVLCPLNMNWRELVVMLVIEQVSGIEQMRLSPFLQPDKGNVTKLMQVMEKKGLIRRTTNDADQRNKLCYLTSQGETLIPQLHSALEYWEEACFEGIDKDALIQFQRVSVLITQNLMKQWNT